MTYLRNQPYEDTDFPAFASIREQFGFLPNFFPAQTMRPDFVDAEINLMAAILLKEAALARRQKEYIFLLCSAGNPSTSSGTPHVATFCTPCSKPPHPKPLPLHHP